jgi:hypothetical protein
VGTVVFTNPAVASGIETVCVVSSVGNATPIVSSGASAPASAGGGTISSPAALGFDDSGDVALQATISGSTQTTSALLRFDAASAQLETVAYNCEPAPGANGAFFAFPPSCITGGGIVYAAFPLPFRGVSIANGGSVSFNAYLTTGQSAIYTQTGVGAPEFVAFDADGSVPPPIGAVGIGPVVGFGSFFGGFPTEILNNGSALFFSYLTSGPADFAIYLGAPGKVQTLMSTADPLPSDARTLLGTILPRAAGHFVLFTAQPAAGRTNLLEGDVSSSTITLVASDNDPAFTTAGGPGGATVLSPNFYVNENGQVAFEAVSASPAGGFGAFVLGPVDTAWNFVPTICGAIFLWTPDSGIVKVAGFGDAVPNSSAKFSCVALNETAPSPLSRNGDVVFISPSPFGPVPPCFLCGGPVSPLVENGDFLYTAATRTVSEIAAAADTLPGQTAATTFVPSLYVPVNASGQVALGAEVRTNSWDFFLRNGNSMQKIVANGDAVPGSADTFGYPHFIAGLTDSGNVAFTAGTSTANDGLFIAPAGGPIETLALDGGAAPVPGGGTFLLAAPSPSGVGVVSLFPFENFAMMNDESDLAFDAAITGGTANSGYFRALQCGSGSCTVQPVALQGQSAPGGGTFGEFAIASNPLILGDQEVSLGPDGALAFVNLITTSSGSKRGLFVARPDGTMIKVAETGDFLPGGGILAFPLMSPRTAAGDAGEFAFLAEIADGNARRGVFVTAIAPGTTATATALSPLQNPAVAQQPVMLTATVTSTTPGAPTGTVAFFANGISLGSAPLSGGEQATLTTSSLAAGPDSLVAQYDGDAKFASDASTPMAIVAAGFAASPSQLTVKAGKSLVIPLTLFAPAGANMNFTLSCSGPPINSSCAFDANPVAPAATGTAVKLTLSTMAGSTMPPQAPRNGVPALSGTGLAAALAAFLAMAALVRSRAGRLRVVSCSCLAMFALAVLLSGCGAITSTGPASSGTPTGATSFIVTGTSGTITITTIVKVTVQ